MAKYTVKDLCWKNGQLQGLCESSILKCQNVADLFPDVCYCNTVITVWALDQNIQTLISSIM